MLALLLAAALLAVPAGDAECRAADFATLEACLADPRAADPAVEFHVLVEDEIVLGVREDILLVDRHNVVLRGAGGPVTITETNERNESPGGRNRYMITVSGGSAVTLADLRLRDAVPNDLAARCRAGANPDRPLRWEKGPCDPPVHVGGGVTGLRIENVDIRSDKPVLLEIRAVNGMEVSGSRFTDGSVFGILFHRNFRHEDVVIRDNEFRHIGANALVVHNAERVLIEGNRFVDDHWDLQFASCGETRSEGCTGGQLLIRDHRDQPVHDVTIVGNWIYQTDPARATATGIEIGDADRATLTGIRVIGNYIFGLGRQAVQVHFGHQPGGHDVTISGNVLLGNGVAGEDGTRGPQITINENDGVVVTANVVVDVPFSVLEASARNLSLSAGTPTRR